jgi:hypothetical protein
LLWTLLLLLNEINIYPLHRCDKLFPYEKISPEFFVVNFNSLPHYISELSKIQVVLVLPYSLSLDIWLSNLRVSLYKNSNRGAFSFYKKVICLNFFQKKFFLWKRKRSRKRHTV